MEGLIQALGDYMNKDATSQVISAVAIVVVFFVYGLLLWFSKSSKSDRARRDQELRYKIEAARSVSNNASMEEKVNRDVDAVNEWAEKVRNDRD